MISKKKIQEFENIIKFQFKDKGNLVKALTHPSFVKEKAIKKNIRNDFERLEFLEIEF